MKSTKEVMQHIVIQNTMKVFASPNYNYIFDMITGEFKRWGATITDDPDVAPAPEILDIEISTICHGVNNTPCKFCYKSNTGVGKNMSFNTFRDILNKMPFLTQIAIGIGDIDSNPYLWDMMSFARYKGIVPNLTINGFNLTDDYAKVINLLCGACAVSRYDDKDVCYNAVEKLTNLGMTQINIHKLLSEETYHECLDVIDDVNTDNRLNKLNAVVFLLLKPKGRGKFMTPMTDITKYRELFDCSCKSKVRMGMDSCSQPLFLLSVKNHPDFSKFEEMAEGCESSRMSSYINVDGRYFHCSFTEGQPGWDGIDVLLCKDFIQDVWNAPETNRFRTELLNKKRLDISNTCFCCPVYKDLYKEI